MRKGFIVALVVVAASFIFFMVVRREQVVYEPVVIPLELDEEEVAEIVAIEVEEALQEIEAFPPVEEIEYKRRGLSDWEHDLLHSPSSLRRAEAARALHAFGPAAVPVLIERIEEEDEDIWIRKWSISSLGDMGRVAKDAIPVLMKVLAGEEPILPRSEAEAILLRREATFSLGEMGPTAAEAIPLLIETLEDDDWTMRLEAVGALGKMGPLARGAIPRLTELLDDENVLVRLHSEVSLGKIRR